MIARAELAKAAAAKRLTIENAETDYLLEMVLYNICTEVGSALVLKGGTALYKFRNLPRFSEDLDFTRDAKRLDLERVLRRTLASLAAAGIVGRLSEFSSHPVETTGRLSLRGPLYDGSKESLGAVTINTSMRERPRTSEREMLIPSYRELPAFDVWVMSDREMFAEKIRAIMSRRRARDAFDVWFLLRRGVRPDPGLVAQKLKTLKLKYSPELFEARLDGLRALWSVDLRGLVAGELPRFADVRREIVEGLRPLGD
ncbi:MAG TPA: nucleotidyl transferase AbiEii/AbiGii toxin family protein [Thermoplasmata archaeon]|nr:nucleotidyl transferase AbiEii/AbiGii toxin family protein [Thermoplasmata archaeon]